MLAFFRRVGSLFDHSRGLLGLTILMAAAQLVVLIPIALLVRRIFDHQIPRHDTRGILVSGFLMLVLYLMSSALGFLSRGIATGITKRAVVRLRYALLEKLYALPLTWHDRQRGGLVHATIVQDSERVDVMLAQLANQILPPVIVGSALVVVAAVISPELFGLLLIVAPAMFLTVRSLGRKSRVRVRDWNTAFRAFNASALLAIRAITLTRVESAEAWELKRHRQQLDVVSEAGQRYVWAQARHSAVQTVLAALAGVLVLVVGATAVARRKMSLGELLSFYAVLALLLRQVNAAVTSTSVVMVGAESLERVQGLLSVGERETYRGRRRLDFGGAIAFESVTFAYEPGAPIIRDVEISISPGEHVTLLGPSGAGKSTVISLLLGLYQPQSGRVLADGQPFDEIDIHDLRRQIGVVLQDPVLLPGSVRENIAYGRLDASEEQIMAAVELATAAPFVERLPLGLETEIGDEGSLLSGGERQRVAIARALVGDLALLVLDEPTTYLEDAAIAELMDNLARLESSPTVLLVTHDLEVARRADRLLVMREGRIVESERASAKLHVGETS